MAEICPHCNLAFSDDEAYQVHFKAVHEDPADKHDVGTVITGKVVDTATSEEGCCDDHEEKASQDGS